VWQIKYQNEFLDITPDQSPEIERRSPLFLVDDILAEYSTPISFAYTDKNSRLLGFVFFDTTAKVKTSLDVELHVKGTFRIVCTLVVESAGMNRLHKGNANAQGYLLLGISDFLTTIKDKLLSDLTLGGVRNFNFTTEDPRDGSDGYWQHFQDTLSFDHDYVMAPCINDAFTDDDIQFTNTPQWINKFNGLYIELKQPVVPFPKLEYVLTQIFAQSGWTLDTSGLNDDEWHQLLMFSLYLIDTTIYGYSGSDVTYSPRSSVSIDLKKAMPEGITCSTFIIELCKRYFWAPVCDPSSRTCYLIALKEVRSFPVKDWSKYATPDSLSDFTVAEKIFAFKNDFEGDDQYPTSLDLASWQGRLGYATDFLALPDPVAGGGDYDNRLFYTFRENKYWQVVYNGSTKVWVEYNDNIYDEEPTDATDTFETRVTTLPVKRVQFDTEFYGLVPRVNQSKFTKWGMRTLVYHGMVAQVDGDGLLTDKTYPYASSVFQPPFGEPELPWSNVWKHSDLANDFGIIQYWSKRWTDAISSAEEITQNFYLPLFELVKFKWNDIIIVNAVAFLIKSYIETFDQPGFIQAKLQKLKMVAYSVPAEETNDVHFTDQRTISEDAFNYFGEQKLHGEAGATITLTVTHYSGSNPDFYFKVNGVAKVLTDTFTVVLDGDGNGSYIVNIGGVHVAGKGLFVQVTITATDIGIIGSPSVASYSKTTG
jgi:hypothetical protein